MPSHRKMIRTSVLLPEDTYAHVQSLAERHDVSVAWIIRHAVIRFLEEHGVEAELPPRLPKPTGASAP